MRTPFYRQFGASTLDGKLRFSVYLPGPGEFARGGPARIAELRVVGSFQGVPWDLATAPRLAPAAFGGGTRYQVELPLPSAGFHEYRYHVTFENGERRYVSDPCCKYGGRDSENSAFVVGGSTPADHPIQPLTPRRPARQLVIYELMPDDFTAEYRGSRAPLDAIREKLSYVRDLGFNALELMPWTAWPSEEFSWGYNPAYFFAVEHRLCHDESQPNERLSRLARLVDEAHQLGLHVIMDCVFNHAVTFGRPEDGRGFPYFWLYQNPHESPFVGLFAENGGFGNDLDYHNECTQQFVSDVAFYWLDEFQLDGLRLDFTKGILEHQSVSGLPRLLSDLHQRYPDIFLSIEHIDWYNAISVANQVKASCWYDPFYWLCRNQLAQGQFSHELMRLFDTARDFRPDITPVTYIENHDHSRVTWATQGHEAWHDGDRQRWFRSQPWIIALLTCHGTPLIYNGQEFGQANWMPEPHEEKVSRVNRVQARPLRWQLADDDIGNFLQDLYRRLIRLRKELPALTSRQFQPENWESWMTQPNEQGLGLDLETRTIVYRRGSNDLAIVALNFSERPARRDIFLGHGHWKELLNLGEVTPDPDGYLRQHTIPSNWGRIFYKEASHG